MPDIQTPFDAVPAHIRDWIISDTVQGITDEILKKYGLSDSGKRKCIALILTWLPLKRIKANEVIGTLVSRFAIPEQDAEAIARTLKARILDPIKSGLLETYGISTEDIVKKSSVMTARTTPLATAIPTKPVVPVTPPRPVTPTAPPPPPIRARVMEMAQVVDLRKPARLDPVKQTVQAASQAPATPAAQTMKIEGSFGSGNQRAATGSNAMNTNQPTSSAATKKPEGESEVLETKREFGLAEVIPKPPAPQEIEVYQDEHPVVDK